MAVRRGFRSARSLKGAAIEDVSHIHVSAMGLCSLNCARSRWDLVARSEWDCLPERCSKGRLLSLINWLAFFCARASKAGILALFAQHIVAGCFGKIAPAATVATKYCLKYLAGASSKILIEICSLCCKMDPEEVQMRPKTAQNGVPKRPKWVPKRPYVGSGCLRASGGTFWSSLGGVLGQSWRRQGASWEALGGSWRRLERV